MALPPGCVVIDNPLSKYYLTLLRRHDTPPSVYREALRKIGFILGYELARYFLWKDVIVETTTVKTIGVAPKNPVYIVGVLGASIPLMHGMWEALPWAGLGLVATRRKHVDNELHVELYYERLPEDLSNYAVIAVDPMLASGKTMEKVVSKLLARGPKKIVIATVVASKASVERLRSVYPDIPIVAISVDPVLDSRFYIIPGIGDAGDRSLSADLTIVDEGDKEWENSQFTI